MRVTKMLGVTVVVLLVTVLAASAFAGWKEQVYYNNFLSIGIEGAQRLGYTYTSPDGVEEEWKADKKIDRYFGFRGQMFLFAGGKLGIGLDALVLDTYKEEGTSTTAYDGYDQYGYYQYTYTDSYELNLTKWLVDLDAVYRLAITPRIIGYGGAGFTYELLTWEYKNLTTDVTETGSETGDIGFNLKAGFEFMFSPGFSASGEWKWQTWESGLGEEAFTIHSFVLGVNLYL